MSPLPILLMIVSVAPGKVNRIDLASSGHVVRYRGESPETMPAQALERGADGWDAWLGPDDQYMIGLEWDAPRDLAEVNIEFRHAIASREQIQVQYWQEDWPTRDTRAAKVPDQHARGKWTTAKAEWWAGDRDVTFAFVPFNHEQPGAGAPDVRFRRTKRLRFLLGNAELPPVRYLKAYGPGKAAEGVFDLSFEPKATSRPPLDVAVVNGDIIEDEDGKPTATQSTQLEKTGQSLTVRYAVNDVDTPNRTLVTLRAALKTEPSVTFIPAEAVKRVNIDLPGGITIHSHGKDASSKPAVGRTDADQE